MREVPPFRRTRRRLLASALACALPVPAMHASAQSEAFPARPVRIVLPQPPGGAADRLARTIAAQLETRWKQSVLVENRPGGGVIIGTTATARAAPDGHTIGLLGSSLSINAVQRSDLPYDAVRDLTPIARLGYYTVALVAAPDFAANDVAQLVAEAKRRPGSISFGSNGIGTSAQLAGEMLNHMAGIELVHVPYNGAAKMYTDIVGGQIPIGFGIATSAMPFVRDGRLKVLGVTSLRRSPLFPDWPAIAETLPGFESVNWAGFAGPAGMPPAIVKRLADDLIAVFASPALAKELVAMGIEAAPQGPDEFRTFIGAEITRFAQVTKPLPRAGK
ncbi:MAG: tripartite tricarboxylate transporter substrate binding protein [Lautropia sp.]